jgi:hypothetical protein
LRPDPDDINLVLDIFFSQTNLVLDMLTLFDKAFRLPRNVQKSSVLPIRCDEQSLAIAKSLLSCQFADFPFKYLGLPLSLNKLPKS